MARNSSILVGCTKARVPPLEWSHRRKNDALVLYPRTVAGASPCTERRASLNCSICSEWAGAGGRTRLL